VAGLILHGVKDGVPGILQSVITIKKLHFFLKITVKGAGQAVVIKAGYII
jgi:hypothetical protein